MKFTPLKSPITASPTYRRYANGKVYTVWKEKSGKVRRRRCSLRNTIDTPQTSLHRTDHHVNTTDRKHQRGTVAHRRG